MPFVGARKAPPGTVVVIEVGLIDVKRENGRKREVNDYLWRQLKVRNSAQFCAILRNYSETALLSS